MMNLISLSKLTLFCATTGLRYCFIEEW